MKEYWKRLVHPEIVDGYYISTNGRIKTDYTPPNYPAYHSSNGYDYIQFVIKKESIIINTDLRYYPVDELVAMTFVQCPPDLMGVPVKIEHIDGDLSNSNFENLKWIEDIEEWKDIPDYNGDYQVSNKGIVKSLKHKNERILLPYYDKDGYAHVVLCKDAITKHFNVHRLVLMAFNPIDNSDKMVVNHIDEIVTNNSIKNLEWCTVKENTNFGTCIARHSGKNHWLYGKHLSDETKQKIRDANTGTNSPHYGKPKYPGSGKQPKKVKCIETGKVYESISEAGKLTGICRQTINRCVVGKCETAGALSNGELLHWEYIE